MIEENRSFFCSELVAKCYKVCGIMAQTEEASCSFTPADFSSGRARLRLVENAHLGREH